MQRSDSALLERWISVRDPEAFAEIIDRHAGMVLAACRRILGNVADAEGELALAYVETYRKVVQEGDGNLDTDFDDTTSQDKRKIYRTREGIDRFFITDINNPAGSALAQSVIPVLIERPGTHQPDGGNVLFLDGHVEYIKYPGKFPMTKAFIEGLRSLDPTIE